MVKLTPKARQLLIGMMMIMAFYMIGRAVNTIIINGIFAAGGDTVLVVYACTCLDEVGKIPWVMLHYRKYKWVKDLTR